MKKKLIPHRRVSILINVHFICQQQSDRIVPVTSAATASSQKGFRACLLNPSGDIDSAGVSIASDHDVRSNDDSITYSEDSDATRIYNLNTRETKIVPPNRQKQHQLRAKIAMMESPLESPVEVTHQPQFFDDEPTQQSPETEDNVNSEYEQIHQQINNGHREMVSVATIRNETMQCECENENKSTGVRRGHLRGEASD